MSINEKIEIRLILKEEDPLYQPFADIKNTLGINSNTEVTRFIIKQISKIPVSKLILDFKKEDPDSIKKPKSTKKEEGKKDGKR